MKITGVFCSGLNMCLAQYSWTVSIAINIKKGLILLKVPGRLIPPLPTLKFGGDMKKSEVVPLLFLVAKMK